ncbi:hypothetical protein ACH5RR_040901 [Cinchona calisaya]|uniref:Uncharacterized protein n=1 Tax=Cinchona calisaya TaxID=153742 RepID=A0ABD2XY32_9GENT
MGVVAIGWWGWRSGVEGAKDEGSEKEEAGGDGLGIWEYGAVSQGVRELGGNRRVGRSGKVKSGVEGWDGGLEVGKGGSKGKVPGMVVELGLKILGRWWGEGRDGKEVVGLREMVRKDVGTR